jgi:uracil-DNA glycosylase family 4
VPGKSFGSVAAVNRAVVRCEACPRLRQHCRQVAREKKRQFREWEYWGKPVPGFGDPEARLVVVGLAPAAHGANRTGRMFTGDSSGDWLFEALFRFGFASQSEAVAREDGLRLTDCYVTASGRCAPPDNKPTGEELARCRPFLEADIRLLKQARITLVLGRIAWQSWLKASGWWDRLSVAGRPPFGHNREAQLPDGQWLLCSYHPSRQNTNTGRLTREMWHGVFGRARDILDHESPRERVNIKERRA